LKYSEAETARCCRWHVHCQYEGILTGEGSEGVMLRGFRVRWVVAAMACALLWVAQVGVGCGSAEDAGSVGSSMEEDGVSSTESD